MRMRRIPALALLALLALAAAGAPAQAVERIVRFVSDVTAERTGDLDVTETIRVQAEHSQINHGILRDFPTTYRRPDGSQVVVGFSVQSVTRDGQVESYVLESIGNGVRVRIGRAETVLSIGEHEYVIRYRATREIGFFADYDELYWNATGNGWTFPIDVAEARITLPEQVPFGRTAFYTGPQGVAGKDASIIQQEPGHIVFRTTRPLPAKSGLTVAAAWPKGVVAPPSQTQQAGWWLSDNAPTGVAGIGLAGLIVFYAFAWMSVGRDPPRGTIIPLFAPPEGMSAAAVRFVERMGFDQRCFTAAIVELGVNRHIKLTGSGKQTLMQRLQGGNPVAPAEQAMEGKLFAANPSLLLDQVNHEPLGKARSALNSGLSSAYDGKLFRDNYFWSGTGLLLAIVVLAVVAVLIINAYDVERGPMVLIGMLFPVLPIAAGAFMVRAGLRRDTMDQSWGTLLIVLGTGLVGVGAFVGFAILATGEHPIDMVPGIAAYVAVPLALLGFRWLQAPTPEGRSVMDRIEGFRQYLGVAEEDRLNALNPPDKTPELFEKFLPYAIALDVENRWAQRFASVLAAAGAQATIATWYQNNQLGRDPVALTNQLSGALSSAIASASSPPGSSSGSDGGGSSGGGGGGGGGSGW